MTRALRSASHDRHLPAFKRGTQRDLTQALPIGLPTVR